ncbi:cadmium-translocating P-type ATPase [Myroides sp. 1354]|uniref:heavy metal translocating P-type ATPase n=1 Tax=unclassified Myroides TaxID=2642485 RepID=UPI002576FBDF|nr:MULTISPECIES: heavy metal translocating P-type ATPase [unclassified Myroides]MDM1045175.1 cadmium-translocating P-type ATPase [Myroides sp. R163-1]MDM1056057.1 cadmium-translocating P-type ATPase [Myroides sp. 1354]MDM1069186.1 cadmium-translocating P-type ATPase [Myroides sp. 1372]
MIHQDKDSCCNSKLEFNKKPTSNHNHEGHDHSHDDHDHNHGEMNSKYAIGFSIVMFFLGVLFANILKAEWFLGNPTLRVLWYLAAYVPVGFPVLKEAFSLSLKKDFFNEFSLMGIATLGAFAIGEYPEAVAVMLFYTIGEMFQESAVNKAKGNIKALLDIRPNEANVFRNNAFSVINPEEVQIGERIQVKVGEKIPLDGILLSDKGSFNTSALTGESKPSTYKKDETVLTGMINLDQVIEIRTTKLYQDSSLAKILEMVQEASTRKAPTELYIRKFAKVYTPIVFLLAVLLTFVPYLFLGDGYVFTQWLERALVFLVISCPCALVISVPLGYFGGIGAASRNGILFKGSNFLELMATLDIVVMDKTGTLTEGVFKVQKVETTWPQEQFVQVVAAIEKQSTHPIAKAIVEAYPTTIVAENVREISGKGLVGTINNQEILVGNTALLTQHTINYPTEVNEIVESIVVVAIDGQYAGYITIADQIKIDAKDAIQLMKSIGVKKTIMLSGDKDTITQKVAKETGIDFAMGGLLPEGKVEQVEQLKKDNPTSSIAFVGDGINDAPVLALSDVGIAMGGLGSDAAIETADVVIQTDQPSKIATAIHIGKETRKIVIQNITLALVVKIIVLILGAGGIATMWEAVFADVGVALLAILNAVRIQKMKFI